MRNTDNGVIGSDQTAVMARLALDELIDQLLHSNALSLKLTANPLVADRAWHLTENTCIRAFSADDPQAKKRAHHALFILYQSWLADPLSPAAANQFHPLLSGIRKSLGVMAMTELLDPPQYEKLVAGCRRIGLSERDVHYYAEHITVDIGHADGWLNNVIVPIGKKHPAAMEEVFFGAALRLQTCNDYYDGLLAALQSLGGSLSSHSVPPSE
ncbi:iron-containing redox enzyme family protein [Klebsiella pneumoniae]